MLIIVFFEIKKWMQPKLLINRRMGKMDTENMPYLYRGISYSS